MINLAYEITKIEERLEELRRDWRGASPAWRKVIEQNAKILKEKQKRFRDKLTEETQKGEPIL